MSDIFSWFLLLLRSNQGANNEDGNARREVTATSLPAKRRHVSNPTTESPNGQSSILITPTKRPKTNQRKSPSDKSSLKQQSKKPIKKSTSSPASSPPSSEQDSEEWLQSMQAWLLHADDGPKLTRKLLRQTMDSVQALASGQGLPATVYAGDAIFLPHHPVDWEITDLVSLKQAAQRFCQQETVSDKRTWDVFVGPMERVQLYRHYKAARS